MKGEGSKVSEQKQEDQKSENSEYAVLIPENMEL